MKVKPFKRQGYYVVIDWSIFDQVMPKTPHTAWKILCFIMRHTKGRQQEDDDLSYSQIRTGTGIRSDATISKGLKQLKSMGIIHITGPAEQFLACNYRLNLEFEINVPPTSKNEVTSTSKNEVGSTSKNEEIHTKKEEDNTKKKIVEKDFLDLLPVKLSKSEKFVELWKDWIKLRREKKWGTTETTAKSHIKKLSDWSLAIAIEMLDQSINRGWRGIFLLHENHPLMSGGINLADAGKKQGETLKSA